MVFSRSDDPEERKKQREEKKSRTAAERQERERREAVARRRSEFWNSPRGRARRAKLSGERYFQVELDVAETARTWRSKTFGDVETATQTASGHGAVLTDIEEEGWELFQAGFVFQETGAVSRDKLLSSGQSVQTTGRVVGIYLFKADSSQPRSDPGWIGGPPPTATTSTEDRGRPLEWKRGPDDGLGDFDRLK